MDWLWEFFAKSEIQAGVIALVAMLFGIVKRLNTVKRWQLTRAITALEAGVRVTYEEYVRAIKDASMDGKLTDAERQEAMRRTLDRARQFAAEDGFDLLKLYAKEYLPVLVDKIIFRRKKVTAPFVSLPAPELP